MFPSISSLIKFKYYRNNKLLKFLSFIQCLLALLLIFFPLYFTYLLDLITSLFISNQIQIPKIYISILRYFFAIPIAILSVIHLIREFLLSKTQIVSFDIKRSQIIQLLNFLMDNYEWKGTCRATLFLPSEKKDKIEIYDRISAGKGIGHFEGKCYFTMGQGVPGRAWENAWSGEDDRSLIKSLQFANVPDAILKNKGELRNFFKEKCGITDYEIYNCMGPKKSSIRSYMGIGILGRYQELICVLVIDSEEPDKFTDFEQLRNVQKGKLIRETGSLEIIGDGDTLPGDFADKLPDFLPAQIPAKIKDFIAKATKELKETEPEGTKEAVRNVALFAQMARSTIDPGLQAPAWLFPLKWVLKQVKEIFITETY